jgi:serine/threonine-protein kinase
MILEPLVQERPDDDRLHAALGRAYAGLGRKTEAIEEGRRATELIPLSRDAMQGSHRLINLAAIYSMVGEVDAAIDVLQELLSIPSWMTVHRLRLGPTWDPLREHPRFQELLQPRN